MNKVHIQIMVAVVATFAATSLFVAGIGVFNESAAQHDLNLTGFVQNQTALAIKYQIDSAIVQQGYINWCVPSGNRTFCGALQAVNFSEVGI